MKIDYLQMENDNTQSQLANNPEMQFLHSI